MVKANEFVKDLLLKMRLKSGVVDRKQNYHAKNYKIP